VGPVKGAQWRKGPRISAQRSWTSSKLCCVVESGHRGTVSEQDSGVTAGHAFSVRSNAPVGIDARPPFRRFQLVQQTSLKPALLEPRAGPGSRSPPLLFLPNTHCHSKSIAVRQSFAAQIDILARFQNAPLTVEEKFRIRACRDSCWCWHA
jgi:hypothetical protein